MIALAGVDGAVLLPTMTIPDYQTVMLPLLRFLSDKQERPMAQVVEAMAAEFKLSPDDRQRLLPSGASTFIGSRVGWARTYLKKAGLVELPRRGTVRITAQGRVHNNLQLLGRRHRLR